ncbi:hypothetical protein, partial [Acinetobacter kanungonis]|uniref:hypothetical protein n=1 Tax=Acinetobacter kanungonis TaxID=2699469 RepID=UPI001C08F767
RSYATDKSGWLMILRSCIFYSKSKNRVIKKLRLKDISSKKFNHNECSNYFYNIGGFNYKYSNK